MEIAETGSINRAAEKLYVGQPNLSRAIKELELSLGVTIFDRSAKGMLLTPDGEVFVRYAKTILKQVDEVEGLFRKGAAGKKRFSLSAPRASYVGEALAKFSDALREESDIELLYQETNSMQTVRNVLQEGYRLGILRYEAHYDGHYCAMMEEKGLAHELLAEFRYFLLLNRNSPLAEKSVISSDDLKNRIEISHADPSVPALPFAEGKKQELPEESRRRIFVFERASQLELLAQNPDTFMWVSPVPAVVLERYGLVQKPCEENKRLYRDVLIYRKGDTLTDLDSRFLEELRRERRAVFENTEY